MHASLPLDDQEQGWLRGEHGRAMQLAMRLVVAAAEVSGASELVAIESAHINSCNYSGRLSLDFAEFLLAEGASTRGRATHVFDVTGLDAGLRLLRRAHVDRRTGCRDNPYVPHP